MNKSSTVLEIENWVLENGKQIGVLVFQKVAKTGNIEKKKKKNPVASGINYERHLIMQKVNRTHLIV